MSDQALRALYELPPGLDPDQAARSLARRYVARSADLPHLILPGQLDPPGHLILAQLICLYLAVNEASSEEEGIQRLYAYWGMLKLFAQLYPLAKGHEYGGSPDRPGEFSPTDLSHLTGSARAWDEYITHVIQVARVAE